MNKIELRFILNEFGKGNKIEDSKYKIEFKNDEYIVTESENEILRFSLFESLNINDVDKSMLKSDFREKYSLARLLKNFFSLDFSDPKLIVCYLNGKVHFVIEDSNKIFDYSLNIIMDKNVYYNLFDIQEKNRISKFDLYNLINIVDSLQLNKNIVEILGNSDYFLNSLKNSKEFSYLNEKYDSYGRNKKNMVLYGDNIDCMMFKADDFFSDKRVIQDKIDEFTLSKKDFSNSIEYDSKSKSYIVKGEQDYRFYILSDFVRERKIRKILLSDERYFGCHENSFILSYFVKKHGYENVYIVSGKRKANDTDYLLHSWVEVDGYVIDFNGNMVMKQEEYYELFDAVIINRTLFDDMNEYIDIIESKMGLSFPPIMYNYFGNLMADELKKKMF